MDLAVPEEVAVLGVDDEEEICELCDPPLSSVIPNAELIGYRAAELLDRLMAGGRAEPLNQVVPPLGITTRQSTDVLAIDDPDVAAAVRYIREHACRGAGVEDVLEHVPVSRSILERRFRKASHAPPRGSSAGPSSSGSSNSWSTPTIPWSRSASWPDSSITNTCVPCSNARPATPPASSAARPRSDRATPEVAQRRVMGERPRTPGDSTNSARSRENSPIRPGEAGGSRPESTRAARKVL